MFWKNNKIFSDKKWKSIVFVSKTIYWTLFLCLAGPYCMLIYYYFIMSSSYTQGNISCYQWGEMKSFFFCCSSVHPWQPRQTNSSHPLALARLDRSKLPTVWLHKFLQWPINPPQLAALACFTAHGICLRVCICAWKGKCWEGVSVSGYTGWGNHTTLWHEIWRWGFFVCPDRY